MKLLIVEDDATSQLMLKTMLGEHELTIVNSGEAGIEAAAQQPDMVILDINLPGIDGYETCRQLRNMEQTQTTPILFLSNYKALEDRLQAYGAGGNDYISKPFDITELTTKINLHSKLVAKQQEVDQQLDSSHKMLIDIQTSAAKLQSISRFIQATLFCHNIDTLFKHFFKTANELGVACILKIDGSSGTEMRSSNGVEISTLEQEILYMSRAIERIHSFGQDRAIFHWGHATLLTRNVGDMIDTLALFMDALEAGIKAVGSESRLLQQVEDLEARNTQVRHRVTDLFALMNSDLRDAILSLGLTAALDLEDEDRLEALINGFSKRIDNELQTLGDNNQIMKQLIEELRTPPPELQDLMDISSESENDGAMLF